ncbi:MAG: hypothetical protein M1817_002776 [Caeruleum heppii]|nr:MAG: hypothetical protein M1817_002776 [Caeruleum heppii]
MASTAARASCRRSGVSLLKPYVVFSSCLRLDRGHPGLRSDRRHPTIRFTSALRAYALGYLSSTSPRIVSLVLSLWRDDQRKDAILFEGLRALRRELAIDRFPSFCGLLIGGATVLQYPLWQLLVRLDALCSPKAWAGRIQNQRRLARFLCALLAAWLSFSLLNSRRAGPSSATRATDGDAARVAPMSISQSAPVAKSPTAKPDLTGKTMDLTLFAVTRAIDVLIGESWSRRKSRRLAAGSWTRLEAAVGDVTDAGVFALSASVIMWAWVYLPNRLPRAYNRWIREAAAVDDRLVEALRLFRSGTLRYGQATEHARLLQSMCDDYGWPRAWGDPAQSMPIPCTMVHMAAGPSCERHALSRFVRAFRFAMTTYLPLNLLVRARTPSVRAFRQAVLDAGRSSGFLAAFISLFYYSICLARTRLGPKLTGRGPVECNMWDSGPCVGAGCATCGWSILVEAPRRRQEIAFFVAPRAAATFFPRRYARKYQWRETMAFATSAAVVLSCAQEKPARVRGVLGRILGQVLRST